MVKFFVQPLVFVAGFCDSLGRLDSQVQAQESSCLIGFSTDSLEKISASLCWSFLSVSSLRFFFLLPLRPSVRRNDDRVRIDRF